MTASTNSEGTRLELHAGDWVVVRSKDEILATLDEQGRLDGLPFQPEMFAFCGKRLRVFKIAHKTCDSINNTGGRRMREAVHLQGARCDGHYHGDCQANCLLFWKEVWLRPADGIGAANVSRRSATVRCTEEAVFRGARAPGEEISDDPTWVCQTTRLLEATEGLEWWDVRQYVRDVTSGNHSAWHMTKLLIFAGYRALLRLGIGYRFLLRLYNAFQNVRGGNPYPIASGLIATGQPTPSEVLDLEPGEWVKIKSVEEIRATINNNGYNRGLYFGPEMVRYCGKRFKVQMRVKQLISEKTGKMLQMKNPCIQLEDVYCRSECLAKRLGCPRAMNTYWREIWLRRDDEPR